MKLCTLLDEFMYLYGSRGPNEWEMRSPTWETRPNLALAAVDRMRLSPESAAPIAQNSRMATDREQLVEQLSESLAGDPATQGQFLAAVRAAQVFLPGRERTKTNNIRMVHEARMTLRELGRRMVERGAFDEIEDFGMLRKAEFDDFLADPHAFTHTIRARRAQYDELSALEPQFVFVGEPDFPAAWTSARRNNVTQARRPGDSLAGLPGCPGVAEGRARVILDSHDPTALEPGDVLVAPITDPSWTPLFVPACAVVVDVGALQSHAVIVSRELGIPCVVSATGATRAIPDGARVRVDGSGRNRDGALMEERWIADTVPSEKYPIYTRANAGEVMPDPVTPMSSTLAIPTAGEQGWRDAYVKAGSFFYDEFDPDRPDTVGVFGGYLYLNMSMTRLYGLRTPGLSPEMVDFQYFGDMPGITPYAEEARPDDENELATQLLQKYLDELFTRDDLPELPRGS